MKAILLLTVFLIPLLGASNSFSYEQIKTLFFIVCTSLIGLLWMGRDFRWSKISILSSIFILILLLTSLLGVDPGFSFLGFQPYFQGWIIYAYLWLFSLVVAHAKIKFEHWAYVVTGSSLLVGVWAIKDWVLLNFFHQQIPAYAGRVVVSFGQPNFYAGFLLLTLPFAYYLFKNYPLSSPQKRGSINNRRGLLSSLRLDNWIPAYAGMTSGLISFTGIFISYSRSAVLLALMLLMLGLLDQLKVKFRLGLIAFGIVCISIVLALRFSSGIVGNEISKPILTKNPDLTRESVEKRVYIWPLGLKIASQKPFTGYGLENIGKAFSNYFEKNKHSLFEENLKISPVLISLKELNIDRSHSYILDLLLFSGILGVLGWLGLLGALFKRLGQIYHGRGKNVLLVSLITYLVWVQFQNQSIVHLIYFWLLVGLIDQ